MHERIYDRRPDGGYRLYYPSGIAGGQELLNTFTDKIGKELPDVRPDLVISKHSEQARADEDRYVETVKRYTVLCQVGR